MRPAGSCFFVSPFGRTGGTLPGFAARSTRGAPGWGQIPKKEAFMVQVRCRPIMFGHRPSVSSSQPGEGWR